MTLDIMKIYVYVSFIVTHLFESNKIDMNIQLHKYICSNCEIT